MFSKANFWPVLFAVACLGALFALASACTSPPQATADHQQQFREDLVDLGLTYAVLKYSSDYPAEASRIVKGAQRLKASLETDEAVTVALLSSRLKEEIYKNVWDTAEAFTLVRVVDLWRETNELALGEGVLDKEAKVRLGEGLDLIIALASGKSL